MTDDQLRQQDEETLRHLQRAADELRKALETMPARVRSIFIASDPRDCDEALALVQGVLANAYTARRVHDQRRDDDRPGTRYHGD